MRTTPSHRMTALVACHMLVAFLLVEGSLARQSLISTSSPLLRAASRSRVQSTNAIQHSLRHKSNGATLERGQFSGLAFLHRERRVSKASCKAIGCSGGHISAGDEYFTQSQTSSDGINRLNSLSSALSIRGGASSDNAVQNILKSILTSSLPTPIKQIIEMICQFIENLTGWKILPRVEEKKKPRSKRTRSKEKEALVEDVSAEVKKKPRSKRTSEKKVEDLEEVNTAVAQKKKRRRQVPSPATSEPTETKETITEKAPETSKPTTTASPKKNPKPKRPDAASQKFLSNSLKSSNPNYRIQRELKSFLSSPPPGLSVKISGKNVRLWVVTLSMPDNTIYAGDTYKLKIQFPNDYPTSPPSVFFLAPTPRHEHVYTNGDICLSLLGKDWRPIMTAQSIAQAIMSILCGAQRKSLPMDNARHAGNKPGKKQDDWVYHDDNC
eukprot:CAMPEP_0172325120 /NCGR_PEP_ID=MMETSP1058-20130122/53205_1 /TAXON_ID=83371 /ORGANISM="Detonula confervacea, Strain CCMP 353" /LENGTH=439 /DNA_ID=CAMNT_0013041585 /DNA_START=14 /DNA_END=1333 /DNA_ORIENTATION=+